MVTKQNSVDLLALAMLINFMAKSLILLEKFKQPVKNTLLGLAFASLYIKPTEYDLMSKESLYSQIGETNSFLMLEEATEFDESPPHQTICIVVDGQDSFYEKIRHYVNRLRLRSKSIKVTREDDSPNYFVKMYVKESVETKFEIHPFRNFQPNSDIVHLAKLVFDTKMACSWSDLLANRFENRVDILLENDPIKIERICLLLRFYMNIESHYYGLYYYVPIRSGIIRAEAFALFIIAVLAHSLFDFDPTFNPVLLIIAGGLYSLCPLTSLLFLRKRTVFIFGIIFSIMNFKFGFLYCLLHYSITLRNTFFCSGK